MGSKARGQSCFGPVGCVMAGIDLDAFETLMRWMRENFFAHPGVTIDAIYHCPDHPSHGTDAYRRETPWRKPKPGMLLQAAA